MSTTVATATCTLLQGASVESLSEDEVLRHNAEENEKTIAKIQATAQTLASSADVLARRIDEQTHVSAQLDHRIQQLSRQNANLTKTLIIAIVITLIVIGAIVLIKQF